MFFDLHSIVWPALDQISIVSDSRVFTERPWIFAITIGKAASYEAHYRQAHANQSYKTLMVVKTGSEMKKEPKVRSVL